MNLKCQFRQFRYDLRYIAMNHPPLYLLLTKFGDGYGSLASSQTDIIIEGFPRSANTFAFLAFKLAQTKTFNIAHHKHATAQFLIAKKYNIPSILLIRRPEDAVISFIIREPCLSLEKALKYWIHFHERLLKDKNSYIIADFNEITKDFGTVIQRVNQYFGTNFGVFSHTKENVNQCFSEMESFQKKIHSNQVRELSIPRPSIGRKDKKEKLLFQLSEFHLRSLTKEANQIYNSYFS